MRNATFTMKIISPTVKHKRLFFYFIMKSEKGQLMAFSSQLHHSYRALTCEVRLCSHPTSVNQLGAGAVIFSSEFYVIVEMPR